MDKSLLKHPPKYYAPYIALVDNIPLNKAFGRRLKRLSQINVQALATKGKTTYAPGKWTIHDIIQHLIDSERIFCYRALMFARKDPNPLAGFDQEEFALSANAGSRAVPDLFDEYKEVHQSSARLFATFDDEMLLQTGKCSGVPMSVLAIGYTIIGHQIHHFNIIKEKYAITMV